MNIVKIGFWQALFAVLTDRRLSPNAELLSLIKNGQLPNIKISSHGGIESPAEDIVNSPEFNRMLDDAKEVVARDVKHVSGREL